MNLLHLAPEAISAIKLSVIVAIFATISSLPFAIAIAYVLARYEFWGKQILNGLVHLPLILPPIVTGYILLILMGKNGIVGHFLWTYFGITFAFHLAGAVLAAAIMSFPLMVRAIRQSFEAIDPQMEQAARSLGAGFITTFWRITIPLASPGILVGMILSFAKAMGEFGATIAFVSNIPGVTQTLPLAIYAELQHIGGEGTVIILSLISIIISIIALTLTELLNTRVRRKIF